MPINECRKAAAEWCAEYGEGWSMKDYVRFSRQNVDLATMDAHLAGQECGEKREREAVVRFCETTANGWTCVSIALAIARGEHRGGESWPDATVR